MAVHYYMLLFKQPVSNDTDFYWAFTEVLRNFGTQNSSCLISSSTWYSVNESGDDSVTTWMETVISFIVFNI